MACKVISFRRLYLNYFAQFHEHETKAHFPKASCQSITFIFEEESNFPKCVKSEHNQQHILALIPPPSPQTKNTVTCLTSNGFPNEYPFIASSQPPSTLGIPTGALIEPLAAAEPVPSSLPPRLKELLPPRWMGTLSYSPKDQRGGKHASNSHTLRLEKPENLGT